MRVLAPPYDFTPFGCDVCYSGNAANLPSIFFLPPKRHLGFSLPHVQTLPNVSRKLETSHEWRVTQLLNFEASISR